MAASKDSEARKGGGSCSDNSGSVSGTESHERSKAPSEVKMSETSSVNDGLDSSELEITNSGGGDLDNGSFRDQSQEGERASQASDEEDNKDEDDFTRALRKDQNKARRDRRQFNKDYPEFENENFNIWVAYDDDTAPSLDLSKDYVCEKVRRAWIQVMGFKGCPEPTDELIREVQQVKRDTGTRRCSDTGPFKDWKTSILARGRNFQRIDWASPMETLRLLKEGKPAQYPLPRVGKYHGEGSGWGEEHAARLRDGMQEMLEASVREEQQSKLESGLHQ